MSAQILKTFYRGTIESIQTGCITAWYGNYNNLDLGALQRVVQTAQCICGFPSNEEIYSSRFIAEESVAAGEKCILTDDPTWIIDPIDGTCNFVHGAPVVAVSIGLAVNKELELGVIYNCVEEKLYTGRKGHGAFCNGQTLQASKETDVSKALILTELGSIREPRALRMLFNNMERLLSVQAHGIRIIGSAALDLCHVASGDVEAFYQFGLHCWDMAAAAVIVREAGGFLIDTTGGPLDLMSRRVVAAGTLQLAQQIAQELQPVAYERDDSTEEASDSQSK
ncbi:inositol monophosphatase 2 isoform X2 [Hypanus sabinus]|uniref:inositol monophosphatase 2 isoform X2 n=1 Tax=Hypanus sabinus TaxID=79690 RepID=UPI0028C4E17A|nr:inositol monophosphatase 2 isoform X2 [Hypanus sabinus]